MKKNQITPLFLLLFFHPAYAGITKTIHPETNLIEWKLTENNLELQLIQRTPNQTRGFFEARGFSKKTTHDIANSCVFQTITRNTSKETNRAIQVSLKTWRIKINNQSQPIKLKETWDKEWNKSQVKASSRLAFRWATFPTEQTFEPSGDYNWGMISFGPEPGSTFDLYVEWKSNNKLKSQWIKNMTCPKNR